MVSKPELELLFPPFLEEMANVATFGNTKYGSKITVEGLKTMKMSKYIGAIKRHLHLFECGIQRDGESGLHHLAHVAYNAQLLVLLEVMASSESDDRPWKYISSCLKEMKK